MPPAATSSAPRPSVSFPDPADEDAVTEILDVVATRCGTPFHRHRRGTVVRRIRNRMISADAPPAPGSFDLVACRNVLIYLEPPAQLRVERLLVAALAPGARLWLGEAEWPSREVAGLLEVVDRRARLFRRAEGRS